MSYKDEQHDHGYAAQWIVFGVMTLAAITFAIAVQFRPLARRLPYYVNIAIMTIAATAYFAMATDFTEPTGDERKKIFARYIDWALTTPLLLLDLIMMTNMPASMISWIIGADVGMIVLGIIGAYDEDDTKWFYFALSCILMFALLYGMVQPIYKKLLWKNPLYLYGYAVLLIYLIVLWVGYPIVWGLGTGGGVIGVDIEIILMGILDILAKPMFAIGVLTVHEVIAAKMELAGEVVEAVEEAA